MSILSSTHSGGIRYWKYLLKERGYYEHKKWPCALVHPDDKSIDRLPDDVVSFEDDRVSVYIVVGSYGRRISIVDIKHLEMIEEYWYCRRNWTNSEFVNKTKKLGLEIIRYYDTH